MTGYPPRDSPEWFDWAERAAIREFEGGYTREDAERLAWEDLQDDAATRDQEPVD